jgi:enamine deaminase RidA (YjgF/YER057c/UK114 family)
MTKRKAISKASSPSLPFSKVIGYGNLNNETLVEIEVIAGR